MARTAEVTSYTVNERGETVAEDDGSSVDADQQESFDDLRASVLGTEHQLKVWVFRQPTDKNGVPLSRSRLGNMFEVPVDQWTMDEIISHIRTDWMARETMIAVRVQVRTAKGQVKWNKLFDIYKQPPPDNRDSQPPRGESSEILSQFRQTIMDMEERFNNRLATVVARAAPAQEPFSMKDMMAMFMQQQQIAQGQKNQEMQTLAVLLSALKPTNSGSSDILTMVKTMGEIKNFAGDLLPSNPASDGESLMGTAKVLAPFATLLAQVMNKNSATTPAQPALPAPQPVPTVATPAAVSVQPTPVAPPSVSGNESEITADPGEQKRSAMLAQLREQLGALAQIAPNKPDAKEVVATLMPMLPTEMDDLIVETLEAPNWFTRLCFIQPAIKPYEEWFTQVRNEILGSYTEVDPNAPPPASAK